MFFNSIQFFVFLPGVFIAFYFTPDRVRWGVLLLASAIFYASLDVPYLLPVFLGVILTSYSAAFFLDKSKNPVTRKIVLCFGVTINLLVLVCLKYLPFISKNVNLLLNVVSNNANIGIPGDLISIGVSFYVFQAISYLVDVYCGIERPERHLGYFALYLCFFAKVLQGPIERAANLLPQLRSHYSFNYDSMRRGLLLILGGLFKKMVIADRLAQYVDPVYNNVHIYSGTVFIVATYLYALQIYFDFSGYTDIAIGTGRLFNINLTENFKKPYFAVSVSDFWRRWHISLSTWFRDYLYIPLGGNRVGNIRRCFNLLIVLLLCGFWHGASWSFITWGLLHGFYLASAVIYRPVKDTLYHKLGLEKNLLTNIWQRAVTFNLVSFAWIFFRANSLSDACYVVTHLFIGNNGFNSFLFSQGLKEFIVAAISLTVTGLFSISINDRESSQYLLAKPIGLRWLAYFVLLLSVLFLGSYNNAQFIYFKF